jgi:hypothetical protein
VIQRAEHRLGKPRRARRRPRALAEAGDDASWDGDAGLR